MIKKLFLIITFLLCANSIVSAQYEKLTHYNIYTNYLDLVHLGGQSFIAYGENGNVLRTDNSFETWEQEFSGIHNDIVRVQYVNDNLYGITKQGDFIWSEDSGNHWESKKISDALLSDFYSEDGTFYISKLTDSVLYSNDYGKTWQAMFVTSDTLRAIFSINKQIILNKNYKELLIYANNKWSELDLPNIANGFPSVNIRKKNNKLFFLTTTEIAILQENLGWVEYNIKEPGLRDVIETESEIICFTYNNFTKNANVVYYNKEKSEVLKKEKIRDDNLHELCHILNHSTIDELGNLIVTSPGKTIFTRKVNEDNWETKTSFMLPSVDALSWYYILDSSSWVFNSFDGNFLNTNDGGVSFKQGKHFTIDTLDNGSYRNGRIETVRFITKDSIKVKLINSINDIALSSDGGLTFQKYESNQILKNSTYHDDYDNYELYYKNKVSHPKSCVLLRKYDFGLIDTLLNLNNTNISRIINFRNRLLLISEIDSLDSFKFYLTDENFINPEEKIAINYKNPDPKNSIVTSIIDIVTNNNDEIFFFTSRFLQNKNYSYTRVYKINSSLDESEIVFNEKSVYFYKYDYSDNNNIISIGILDENKLVLDYYFAELNIDDDFKFELKSEKKNELLRVYHAVNDNSMFFYNKNGHFWKPIEEGRIHTNVVEVNSPPSIWTYPPYPNPAVDQTKIQFYSGIMSDANSLQLKVVNISTGQEIKGLDYNITANNNWNGTLNLETGKLPTGSYLLEFKLRDRTTTEKLIIAR